LGAHYGLPGVARDASPFEIRDAYRRREYDLSLSVEPLPVEPLRPFFEPARFPWRFLGVLFLASPVPCPEGVEAHRDHLGLGTACVRLG